MSTYDEMHAKWEAAAKRRRDTVRTVMFDIEPDEQLDAPHREAAKYQEWFETLSPEEQAAESARKKTEIEEICRKIRSRGASKDNT